MSPPTKKTLTVTAKISPTLGRKLTKYAKLTERTTSAAVERLLSDHIDYDVWFVTEVRKGLEAAKRGELLSHEQAMQQIRDYVADQKRRRAAHRKAA